MGNQHERGEEGDAEGGAAGGSEETIGNFAGLKVAADVAGVVMGPHGDGAMTKF